MKGYHGGQVVKEGLYLNVANWELESVSREGNILSGDREVRYVKVPLPSVIVAGPLSGLAYVISLPIVFSLVFGYFLTRRVTQTPILRKVMGGLIPRQ